MTAVVPAAATESAPTTRLSFPGGHDRQPGLDGLRGVAVLSVMAFHAGLPWARGGLLGVDIFFVLSGFLITSLLLSEHVRFGRISLRAFWGRRARRLLPAMLLMLVTTCAVWYFTADPSELKGVRNDALSTLGYFANWHFAFAGQGYFDHLQAQSPLLHMWSLAVEEQFYLIWPLIVALVLARKGPFVLRRLCLIGAVGSAGLLAALSFAGASNPRLYYGTDTRATALLVGAALATVVTPLSSGDEPGPRRTRVLLGLLGLLAAVPLGYALVKVDGQAVGLYRGGFFGVSALVAIVVASVLLAPKTPLGRLLSVPPLRAIGRISYGLYLWHWPIDLFVTHARTGLEGNALLGLRVGITFCIATLSWFLLEQPILRRRPRRTAVATGEASVVPAPRRRRRWGGFLTTVAAVGAVALLVGFVPLPKPKVAGEGQINLDELERQSQQQAPPPPTVAPGASGPLRLMVVGDSTALTLGVGFAQVAPQSDAYVADRGTVGCGVSTLSPLRYAGNTGPILPPCLDWQSRWQSDVNTYKPEVVVVLLGRWEVADRMMNGRWVAPGDPAYDKYLSAQLDTAIKTLSAHGAKVAMLTAPSYAGHEGPGGTSQPEDNPARMVRWKELLRAAAARHPDVARIFDLRAILDPHGHFQRYSDDGTIELRSPDGIHIGLTGGEYAAGILFPQFRSWARGASSVPSGMPY